MPTFIVDTNLILVAEGLHAGVSEHCVQACAARLREIMESGRIAMDDGFRILDEYQHKLGQPTHRGAGSAFVEWALKNHDDPARCDSVPITEEPYLGFETFPADERLAHFDLSDRKFVAVAAAHPDHPPILQAADSKWLDWAQALQDYEIEVDFVCPDDVARFHDHKLGRHEK